MKVKFVDLYAQYLSIKPGIDHAIASVIEKSAFIGGEVVKDFEKEFSALYGIKHCISVANGTDSLYILLKMLGIGSGDEVITVANSWISSSETITQAGAKPVFVDIDETYYSMDETMLEKKITGNTKAVIAVHLQGQMCAINTIKDICERHHLFLIEDCAQSHFSEYKGTRAGLRGIAGSFSFYPGKNLGAYGDAGCIITNNDQLAEKCRMYANHGSLTKHDHRMEGINSRLDGIQAAILKSKLPHILKWTEERISKANYYSEKIKEKCPSIITPAIRPGSKHSFHLYVIRAQHRNELKSFLESKDIETAIHYPRILPALPAYSYLKDAPENYPVALKCQEEILSLPLYPEITTEQIDYVVDCLVEFYKNDTRHILQSTSKVNV